MKTKPIKKKKIIDLLILYLLFVFPMIALGQDFETNVNDYLSANNEVSSIGLTANIKSKDVVSLLKKQFVNPVVEGESEELGFMLHADEAITKEKLEKILTTPAREAYDEIRRIPRTITRSVKVGTKALKCYTKPWKWHRCWKDVYKDVTETIIDEIKVRIPAVEAVYKDVLVPFIEINQTIFGIKGNFKYNVNLDNVDVDFEGNKYTITGFFDVNIRTSIYLDHLPQTITPKGNYNSRFKIKLVQKGFIEIDQNGLINVTKPTSNLQFTEVLGSGFLVDAIDLGSKTVPVTDYLLDLTGKKVDEQINKAVTKIIAQNSDKINIKTYASNLVKQFDKPIELNDEGLIYPNITGLFVSQLNGIKANNENQVQIKFGVTFQPFATFNTEPLPVKDKDTLIRFNTDVIANEGINVVLPAFLTYDFVVEQLKPFIKDFNDKNEEKFLINKYAINNPTAIYSENGNVNLKVDLFKKKKNKKIGSISMDARFFATEADTSVCVKVSKIKIESSNLLVFLGKGIIKKAIIKETENNSCKSVASDVIKASQKIDEKMVINTPLGIIQGETQSLTLSDILAYPEYILLKINLKGTVKLNNNTDNHSIVEALN